MRARCARILIGLPAVLTLVLLSAAPAELHAAAPARKSLPYTSFVYDDKTWNVVIERPDDAAGVTFAIRHRGRPIVFAISERPDRTTFMLSLVVMAQLEEAARKQRYRFDPMDESSPMNGLKMPDGWTCKHHISQMKKDDDDTKYLSHCVWIGSGYWSYAIIVAPLDVTPAEVALINQVSMTVAPRK